MLTALHEQTDRNGCLQAGADDFIAKPFDNRELQLRVDRFLRLRARTSSFVASAMSCRRSSTSKTTSSVCWSTTCATR